MRLCFLLCKEETCRLNYILCSNLVPFQIGRILLCCDSDCIAVNNQFAILNLYCSVELAMHCVILEHICHILYINKVVNSYNLNIISVLCSSENQTSDTSESVDTNFNFAHCNNV